MDKNIYLTEIAQENKPYSKSSFNGSTIPLFNRSSTGVINSDFKQKKETLKEIQLLNKIRLNFLKF